MRRSLVCQTNNDVRPSPTPVMSNSLPPPTCLTSATSGSPMATRAMFKTCRIFCSPTASVMVPPSDCAKAGSASRHDTAASSSRRAGVQIVKRASLRECASLHEASAEEKRREGAGSDGDRVGDIPGFFAAAHLGGQEPDDGLRSPGERDG